LTAALKPWRQYARRYALWQALPAVAGCEFNGFVLPKCELEWFRFAKMPARISNVTQPIDNISLFQLQRSVNAKIFR